MVIELRTDSVHISGYVNVPGRPSRPVVTPRGKVIEVIDQGAFQKAIDKAPEIRVLADHNQSHAYATTKDNTLSVKEDNIGLHADADIADPFIVNAARKAEIRGWSFDMRNVDDTIEERADGELPVRHVHGFDMSEITLAINRIPVYSSTSVEVRANVESDVEYRAFDENVKVVEEKREEPPKDPDPDDTWKQANEANQAKLDKHSK